MTFNVCFAQYQIKINALVLDKVTNKPLPYVNIGFLEKGIGTVSNESGKFSLVYDENNINDNDILQLSILGYSSKQLKVSDLYEILKKTNIIYLNPKSYILNEIVLSNTNRETKRIGFSSGNYSSIGYWKDKDALGGEIATKFRITNKNTKILDLKFDVVENLSDSLKIRVNIYNYHKRYPEKKIVSTNIYHIIKRKKGEETIDLKPYNIIANDDIVIGLELVEVYGNKIGFALSGNYYRTISYTRYISHDKWKRKLNVGMNFSILTSVPEKGESKGIIAKRNAPNRISLYWDMSLSTKKRLLEKELKLLSSYFKKIGSVEVELVKFSNSILERKTFLIKRGNSKDLLNYLNNIQNNGGTNFNEILADNDFKADVALLFSDGKNTYNTLESNVDVPIFCVNSLSNANHLLLQDIALFSEGHYVNLNKNDVDNGLKLMLNKITDLEDYSAKNDRLIQGKIINVLGALQGATVKIKDRFDEVQTNNEGKFKINAVNGDVLIIDYLGMLRKEILVNELDSINIELLPDNELLDEIVLETRRKEDKEKIESGYGSKNKKEVGFAVDQITADEISPSANNLADVIKRGFPGVTIAGQNIAYNTPKFFIRGGGGSIVNRTTAIFVIDGNIYTETPDFINPQNIASITILRSIISTNRYGSIARGGAFLVKTKSLDFKNREKQLISPLIKGNDYNEDVKLINSVLTEKRNKNFNNLSIERAKEIYFVKIDELKIPLFIDSYEYFEELDSIFANTILSNISEIAHNNAKGLKTLAYKLEEANSLKDAKIIYEYITSLQPFSAQSYLNAARIYVLNGSYEAAMKLYKRMLSNSINGIDFTSLRKSIESEIFHLLAHHKTEVNYKDLPSDLRKVGFKYDYRLVFEWNDPKIEFELQFVNPNKKFFKWTHTMLNNKERMLDEVKNGYSSEEFIIDDDKNKGEWIINLENFSNKSNLNPTYLKYTLFKNYGLSNESKEIKVIELNNLTQKITIDKFLN